MWDNGASLSFITNSKARAENLHGATVERSIVKVGGQTEKSISHKFLLDLIDLESQVVQFEVYGIDKITTDIRGVNIDDAIHLFKNVTLDELRRPAGAVDVLIGYGYAGYHPQPEQKSGHFLLLKIIFERCLGGTHVALEQTDHVMECAQVHHVSGIKTEDFFSVENLGVECKPRCGGYKCGGCSLGAKNYSLRRKGASTY